MPLTRSTVLRSIRITSAILLVVIIGSYAVWRSLDYARGPSIVITEPGDNSSFATSTVIIRGKVERVNNLLLNGNPLLIDEKGNFGYMAVIFPGINIFTLTAQDQFHRSTEARLHIVGLSELPKSNP